MTQPPLFIENLRAPAWTFALLGLMLGAVSGGLTAVGIRQLTGDPLLSGSEALLFYIAFAIGVVGIVYVMLNSTLMETKATSAGIAIKLGVLGTQRNVDWNAITEIRASEHNVTRHGGRGNPFAPSTRRSWIMFGVRSGVEVEIADRNGSQLLFVSSLKSEELVEIVKGKRRRSIVVGRKIQGEIEEVAGLNTDEQVVIRNTRYWVGPDIVVAKGLRSRLRDHGRVWDFDGKSAEICRIDWSGP